MGKLALKAPVGVETIRFHEREGLIAEPPRQASGYRRRPCDTIRRVRLIRRAKRLGFTLREVGGQLSLRVDPQPRRADVQAQAEEKIADLEDKVSRLRRLETVLASVNDRPDGSRLDRPSGSDDGRCHPQRGQVGKAQGRMPAFCHGAGSTPEAFPNAAARAGVIMHRFPLRPGVPARRA